MSPEYKNLPKRTDVLFIGGPFDGKYKSMTGELREWFNVMATDDPLVAPSLDNEGDNEVKVKYHEYHLLNIHLSGFRHQIYYCGEDDGSNLIGTLLDCYIKNRNSAETGG